MYGYVHVYVSTSFSAALAPGSAGRLKENVDDVNPAAAWAGVTNANSIW